MAKKPSLGRQKIKIAKIEKPNHRQVTFSKRRSGLFKKACELCTLCGVEIVIIVFSPASKVFSFGHPSVDALVDRFLLSRSIGAPRSGGGGGSDRADASVRDLNAQLTQVQALLDAEKERKEALDRATAARQGQCWWEAPVDRLGKGELEQLAASLEELKKNVAMQAKLLGEATPSSSSAATNVPMIGGGGSVRAADQFEAKPRLVGEEVCGSSAGLGNNGFSSFAGGHHGFGGF